MSRDFWDTTLGFSADVMPHFEFFLSCGIPGKVEGERYKKSPEIVRESMRRVESFDAPARYAVFKRWDMLEEKDEPLKRQKKLLSERYMAGPR